MTPGGILINPVIPSLTVDSEAEADSEVAETVIVERSRSAYEAEDDEIDLRIANNFTIAKSDATEITFASAGYASDISDGQSGYIIITADASGTGTINPVSGSVYVPTGSNPITVASSEVGFISYTVAGSIVYLSSAIVVDA